MSMSASSADQAEVDPPSLPARLARTLRRRHRERMDATPLASVLRKHPPFLEAVLEDARVTAAYRTERHKFTSRWDAIGQAVRLASVSDAYLAQVLYRAKASLQAAGIPGLPRVAHRLAMMVAQVCIGDPVVVGPGLYLPHGQIVIDGVVEIGPNVTIRPWVTIGLKDGDFNGAHIDQNVRIGTGAKIIGPVHIGEGAHIGANAVVLQDVPAHAVAVGVPAKVIDVPTPQERKRAKRLAEGRPDGVR
jgi:serine O-acetyltransferase